MLGDYLSGPTITFKLLEKTVGNKVEAARICGLERKTTYGWHTPREIRLRTKRKALTALIENLTEETRGFITERSVGTSVDILPHIFICTP